MTRLVSIEGDFPRTMPTVRDERFAEEGFGRGDTTGLAQVEVYRSTLFVDCTLQVMPRAFDIDERLIHPPRGAHRPGKAIPTLFELGDVALNPTADSARGHRDAALEHHLRQITIG